MRIVARILVTGATGYLGSVLMPELLAEFGTGSLAAFALPGESLPETWREAGVAVFRGDIADREAVAEAVRGRTHVLHLAALISYRRRDREALFRVNREGTRAVVEACLAHGVRRLVHVSTVGAVGFRPDGGLADEETPFNWPDDFPYMTSKRDGQTLVEKAAREGRLEALILNAASIMGPGDANPDTPQNQLFERISRGRMFGCFAGGLAVVDVRDLSTVILKALEGGRSGEKYLVVGANLTYREVVRMIGARAGRRVYPFRIPGPVVTAAGAAVEWLAERVGRRPLLTRAYGKLSGVEAYYANGKSRAEFSHEYRDIGRTIDDGWAYFERTILGRR
ncbi:MAG: NAD-dependent epimerase/dehydratase family protein [Candidatus Aminicenantes bacterium]|nr:NAD-dependent epimerase/dehydratase family protein [Candidatus Aminicenantes bacterium]